MATEVLAFRPPAPVSIFISYSHRDEALKNELLKHLSLLKRQGIISHWHDREIRAGADWSKEIDSHLESAQIILLLVSSDFLASDYCYEKEMNRALEKHDSGQARVIPIFLRPCDWRGAPFGQLQGLPLDAKPVAEWENPDSAFSEVARSIRMIAGNFQQVIGKIEGVAPEKQTALHQLPPSPADFTGRADEINELVRAVREDQKRIIGIFGMGGLGKTALALKIADQIKEDYPDGQIYLDLKGVGTEPLQPKEIMAYVIRSFDLTANPPDIETELAALYRSVLHEKRVLVIMDNSANAKQLESLVPPSTCLLVTTSRFHFPLPGLLEKNLDALTPRDAKALLIRITGRLEQAGDQCIADLAHLCGHLPLALRIAANALHVKKSLKPPDYVRRLQDTNQRLGELKEVEASLQVSYDLLSERMQIRFRYLAVFPDTFDTQAAAAIWNVENQEDIAEETLEKLLLYSLIEFNESVNRYRLHDLVRLFADTTLSIEEREAVQCRHAGFYLDILKTAEELYLQGSDASLQGLALVDAEWGNIQVGQAWSAAHASSNNIAAEWCYNYCDRGFHCVQLRQRPTAQIAWLVAALSSARRLKNRACEGRLLGNLSIAYLELGDCQRSISFCKEALAIFQELGDRLREGQILDTLGNAYAGLDERAQSIECHKQALAIQSEAGSRHGEANALINLSVEYWESGEHSLAMDLHRRALTIFQEIGDRRSEGQVLGNLGVFYSISGNHEQALVHHEKRLIISQNLGDRNGEANALWNSCLTLYSIGDREKASARAEAALKIYEEIESPRISVVRSWLAKWHEEKKAKGQAAE